MQVVQYKLVTTLYVTSVRDRSLYSIRSLILSQYIEDRSGVELGALTIARAICYTQLKISRYRSMRHVYPPPVREPIHVVSFTHVSG